MTGVSIVLRSIEVIGVADSFRSEVLYGALKVKAVKAGAF